MQTLQYAKTLLLWGFFAQENMKGRIFQQNCRIFQYCPNQSGLHRQLKTHIDFSIFLILGTKFAPASWSSSLSAFSNQIFWKLLRAPIAMLGFILTTAILKLVWSRVLSVEDDVRYSLLIRYCLRIFQRLSHQTVGVKAMKYFIGFGLSEW